jgi:alpha-tubulin suppressor-like RCC1 family protein
MTHDLLRTWPFFAHDARGHRLARIYKRRAQMASGSRIISSWTPVPSVGLGASQRLAVAAILAGVAATSVTAQFNGEFTAWGNDSFGQCQLPTSVQLSSVAGGNLHSLGLTAGGLVVAWGANAMGQCEVPPGITDAVQIAAGGWYQTNDQRAHSMALLRDRTVVAWGSNEYGQCDVPGGLSNVKQIACGWAHSAALLTDGSVVMWGAGQSNEANYQGANWGQRKIPSDLGFIEAISTKGCHMVALQGDGTIRCWGRSDQGQ